MHTAILLVLISAAIASLIIVVLLIGTFLPEKHVAMKVCHLEAPPEEVWAVITDFLAQPKWRANVQRVERLADHQGNEVWREVEGRNRQLSYETMQAQPPYLLIRKIVDEGLPFGGSWTFEITPERHGSQLKITEHGEVHNVLFRFVSRFVIGHTATMQQYLKDLQQVLKGQSIAA
jgi:uncharacterized protein YndB with AHSA1/START domain